MVCAKCKINKLNQDSIIFVMKQIYDKYLHDTVFQYTIQDKDLKVEILDLGARINKIEYKGKNIILGVNSIDDYIKSNTYMGATIGRCANRIKDGIFTLNNKKYNLYKNDNQNHLHGGKLGFDKRKFTVLNETENSISMEYYSVDLEESYPGNLKLIVNFKLMDNSLKIEYIATADQDTLFNPTSHIYFNLDGEESENCLKNSLMINASSVTCIDDFLIPTGKVMKVEDTPFDFQKPKLIEQDIHSQLLKVTNGYDHNYILNDCHGAKLTSLKSKISMDLYTDLPCMQLYSGGAIKPCKGLTRTYNQFQGLALEPQFCPDAININDPNIEKPILKENTEVCHFIKYQFESID